MKKIILVAAFTFGTYMVSAQAPEKMSYQSVVRNTTGQLIQNQNVGIKASILQNSGTGTVVYSERLMGTTNANGLVSLAIGSGTVLSGTFSSIDWSTGNYYLKTETDPTGGTNYTIAGTSQLLSVPYAMYAKSAGESSSLWTELPPILGKTNIMNSNNGDVGIGTNNIFSPLTVKARPLNGFSDSYLGYSQISADGNTRFGIFTSNDGVSLRTNSDHNLYLGTYIPGGGVTNMTLQKVTGNVGINQTNPTEKLEVAGKTKTTNLQVTNGAGVGKVLTSDATGNATWQNGASINFPIISVQDNYTATDNDYTIRFVAASSTNISKTITLPAAAGRTGRIYKIFAKIPLVGPVLSDTNYSRLSVKEAGTGTDILFNELGVTVMANRQFRFDGLGVDEYQQFTAVTVQSDGTSWIVIDNNYRYFRDYWNPPTP